MNFEKIKKLIPEASTIAELRSGARYLVTFDGCSLNKQQMQSLERELKENGLDVVLVQKGFEFYVLPSKADESLDTQVHRYASLPRALEFVASARVYQTKDWPKTATVDAGGRSTEEWLLLLQAYQAKLIQVWAESKGSTKEGLERVAKYAAIQANLALWALQAAQGAADNFTDGGYLVPPGAVGPISNRTEAEVAATDADWADFQDYRNSGGFLITFDGWLSAGKPRAINQNKACKK